jgi:hypothetical protein
MADRDLDGMTIFETVKFQSPNVGVRDELSPDIILRKQMINAHEP